MRNIVEIKEVFKTIDKEEILSGINLQIAEGEIDVYKRQTSSKWICNIRSLLCNNGAFGAIL